MLTRPFFLNVSEKMHLRFIKITDIYWRERERERERELPCCFELYNNLRHIIENSDNLLERERVST